MLEDSKPKLLVLLCHHNADPDSIGSAYALYRLLEEIKPTVFVEIAAQGLSKISRQILKKIDIPITRTPRIEEADALVLMDTNTIQQLDEWKKRVEDSDTPLILIDHHAPHPDIGRPPAVSIIDEDATSTCEIVFDLFKEAKVELRTREALALFLGIAFDTRHFGLANSKTFHIATELIKAGVDAKNAISLLSLPMDNSERIARLKAAKRLRFVRMGEWVIVLSNVSTYQASAARGLLNLGAHVAIVGGKNKGKLRVSLRASEEFRERTGIHLGKDVAKPLGEYVHGKGGGHAISAGVNGEGDLGTSFEKCIDLLKKKSKGDQLFPK